MDCPKCQEEPLNRTTIDGVEVDLCAKCRGVWFDERELTLLLNEPASALRPLTRGADRMGHDALRGNCPRDAVELLRVSSARDPKITLDICPQCRGIWLDGGEFKALLKARQS